MKLSILLCLLVVGFVTAKAEGQDSSHLIEFRKVARCILSIMRVRVNCINPVCEEKCNAARNAMATARHGGSHTIHEDFENCGKCLTSETEGLRDISGCVLGAKCRTTLENYEHDENAH